MLAFVSALFLLTQPAFSQNPSVYIIKDFKYAEVQNFVCTPGNSPTYSLSYALCGNSYTPSAADSFSSLCNNLTVAVSGIRDDLYCPGRVIDYGSAFTINNLPLGVDNLNSATNGHDVIRFYLYIGIPQPAISTTGPSIACPQQTVTLTASISWANLSGLFNQWEYRIGSSPWKPLATNPVNQPLLLQYQNFANLYADLQAAGQNTTVQLRVAVKNSSDTGPYSYTTVNFSPPPPTVPNPATDIVVTPSCPDSIGTGTITVTNISGSGQYLYVLRKGSNDTSSCDPDKANCLTGPSGTTTANTFTLADLKAGQYTLWLANSGGSLGVCSQTYNVTVPQIPVLAFAGTAAATNASCYNAADGSVTLSSTGGKAPIVYTITNGTNTYTQTVNTTSTPVTFGSLPAGSYTGSVTDACGQVPAPQTFTIRQPARVTLAVTPIAALCTSPGDGKVQASVSVSTGAFDLPVSGSFDYQIRNGGTLVQANPALAASSYTFMNLPVGSTYAVRVRDAAGNWCSGDEKPLAIAGPAAIPVPVLVRQDVACAGGSEGGLTISGMGGNGAFQYTLRNTVTGQIVAQTTQTTITGLVAGSYQLVVSRIHPNCSDSYTHPALITITEPSALTLNYTHTNVSCYGAGDGKITPAVSGGTPPYSLFYRKDTQANWTSFTGPLLNNLDKETYRLRVVDKNNCETVSDKIVIAEPAPLQLTSVKRADIQCLGGSGFIDITATGGTVPYRFEYAKNGGAYTVFDKNTPLDAGLYQVRVIDANGCSVSHAAALLISTPAAALDFTYTLSDYNGFNISCYGGTNGTVTLTATGGNGGGYTGYEYAIDAGRYQSGSVMEGIGAGTHSIAVKDARGCVVTKTVTFTQSASQLSLALQSKTDVVCAGDRTGSIQVSARGGVGPYEFSLNGADYASSLGFTGLAAGTYQIRVRDKNNCVASLSQTITSLYPPIRLSAQISGVSCKAGADGTIALTASGGQAPYRYQWSGQSGTSSGLTGLAAGSYTVTITDQAGCSKDTTLRVPEPEKPLSLVVQTTPVCYGKTNGLIQIRASGGTPPYRYSVDNGQSFQASAQFTTVGVGSYAVLVADSKNCTATATALVEQRNEQPTADFIVATRQNALDTMVIRDISWPKPDSVRWQFDARAQVLDTSAFSATIRFATEGSYTLGMTGYFGGCAYSVSRNLTIAPYDPDAAPVALPGYAIIKKFEVSPNPANGQFEVRAQLIRKQQVTVVVLDVLGNEKYRKRWDKVSAVTEVVNLSGIASGLYVVRLITDNDAAERRLVVTP